MAGEWDSYLEEAHRASLSEGNHQGDKKNGVLDETLK